MARPAPRFAPDRAFPPYPYVPGQTPHPTRDPAGHSYGVEETPAAPDPGRWRDSGAYLYGIDLFNHGYYWEAHEAWEALWHACGRTGRTAAFLQGLIALAAAGFKAREGIEAGVRRHGERAAGFFVDVAADDRQAGSLGPTYMGLDLGDLVGHARAMADRASDPVDTARAGEGAVFPFDLRPESGPTDG